MSNISLKYFDPFNVFDTIKHEIETHFPIQNVHYQRHSEEKASSIEKLDLKFTNDSELSSLDTFFNILVISCSNIDEYRNKIRPIITQWLSNNKEDQYSKSYKLGVFLIQTTVEDINDNKMFNRKNITEKIQNDFVEINHIFQFPSFFKSIEEKNQLFTNVSLKLQKNTLKSLQMKLDIIESFESDLMYVYTQSLNLYLKFRLLNQADDILKKLDIEFLQDDKFLQNIDSGIDFKNYNHNILEFFDYENFHTNVTFTTSSKDTNLNYMDLLKYKMIQSLHNLTLKHQPILHSEIKVLYKAVVTDFIFKIKILCCDDYNIDVFIYRFITDFVMDHSLLRMNLNEEITMPHQNKLEWNDFLGQIAYIKRQTWSSIIDKKGLLNFKINDHTIIHTDKRINFDIDDDYCLNNVLDDYIGMTQHIVSYWKEMKPISIDLLASDIGILLNKAGQHEKTIAILHSTFEYYNNVLKWEDLAIQILEVYIDALEKIYSKREPKNVIINDELVPVVTVLANSYLNLICLLKDKKSYFTENESMRSLNFKQYFWKKFLQLSDNTDLTYPLDKIITFDVNLNSELKFDDKLNVFYYFVKMNWSWLIDTGIVVSVNNVKLKMRNTESDRIIVFEMNNVVVTDNKDNLELKCYDIEFGSYEIVSLEVFLNENDTIFLKDFDQRLFINLIPLYDNKKLNLLIKSSSEYYEDEISLDLIYENWEHLKAEKVSLEIEVFDTDGIYIKHFESEVKKIVLDNVAKDFDKILLINRSNYDMTANKYLISFKITMNIDDKYKEVIIITKSFSNPLVISHNAILKKNFSFINLNMSSITEPVNIIGTELILNDDQRLATNLDLTVKNILLPKNPLSTFKNFFPLNDISSIKKLEYEVKYKTLRTSIEEYLTSIFFDKYPGLKWYKIIWRDYVLPNFQFHINQFIHFKIIKLKVYNETDFLNYLKKIDNKESELNQKFMGVLLDVYRTLFDGVQLDDSDKIWNLGSLQIMHKQFAIEELEMNKDLFTINLNKNFDDVNLKVGDCYSFDIKVAKPKKFNSNKKKYICEVEISDNINTWLISGFNKFYLDETQGDESFNLFLIPIKRGYLKYPKITIKNDDNNNEDAESQQKNNHIIDFVNTNENVIVI